MFSGRSISYWRPCDSTGVGSAVRLRLAAVLLCVNAVLWLHAAEASAQGAELSGVIRDIQGGVVVDVEIRLTDQATDVSVVTKTNGRGIYVFPSLRPSTYQLNATLDGFAPLTHRDLVLNIDQRLSLDLVLTPAEQAEAVTVKAARSLLGAADGSLSTVVDRTFAEGLPIRGRSFETLVRFSPGAVGTNGAASEELSFNINGQRNVSNYLTVDGVAGLSAINTNGGIESAGASGQAYAATAVGTVNGGVTMDALQEIRIQTSSFAAEFGRTPGAQISLVTRSGTNQLRGSLFEQFLNDALMANDWFANSRGKEKAELDEHQFGGTLGGPLLRGRTFFFASYEGLRLKEPDFVIDRVPSLEAREQDTAARDILDVYPLPTGPSSPDLTAEYAATHFERRTSDTFGLRLDHVLRSGTQLFGRYARTASTLRYDHPLSNNNTNSPTRSLTAGLTASIGSRTLVELRAAYGTAEYKFYQTAGSAFRQWFPASDVGEPLLAFGVSGLRGLSDGPGVVNVQRQGSIVGSWSHVMSAHHIKAGVDYRWLKPYQQSSRHVSANFGSVREVLDGRAVPALTVEHRFPVATLFQNVSMYLQDTWKARRQLSLTYGVRWDLNPAPSFRSGEGPLAVTTFEPITQLALSPTRNVPLWKTDYNNVFPRVGFSYALGRDAALVLSGGAGIYGDLQGPAASLNIGKSTRVTQTNVALPLTAGDLRGLEEPVLTPPYHGSVAVVDPNLATPRTTQWNVSIERALGLSQVVSVAYVGAKGEHLLQTQWFPNGLNENFPNSLSVRSAEGESRYHAFQLQYRRRAAAGVHVLASYTFGEARDTASFLGTFDRTTELAPSDHDVRHSFNGAIGWMLPSMRRGPFAGLLSDWQMHMVASARSAYPFTVIASSLVLPGEEGFQRRASLVPGIPIVVDDPTAPGGRRYNLAAFTDPTADQQGNTGRNAFRGFSAYQFDAGVQRAIPIASRLRMHLRVDVFNVFNTPTFGPLLNWLQYGESLFGRPFKMANGGSLNKEGGPRSVALSVRCDF